MSGKNKIYVGNLPLDTTELELMRLLTAADLLPLKITILKDEATDMCLGFGFISFYSITDAEKAIQLLDGRKLKMMYLKANFTNQ
jgi:RNA recognition motif-containing protein